MQFRIAIFPSKEVQDAANNYRKRYDPHFLLIPPYVPVRQPEEWDEHQLRLAVEQLEKATAAIAPFTLRINRFSSANPAASTVYMAFADIEPLIRLRDAVCRGVLAESPETHVPNPYIIVGQRMSPDEFHDVSASLRKVPIDFSFETDRIHLLYQTDHRAWTPYQTFLLRGAR